MDITSQFDILKLAELLRPPEEEIVPEDDLPKAGYRIERSSIQKEETKLKKFNDPKTIEEFELQQENELAHEIHDYKKEPSYNIKYRQAVTPEDVYLQMGAKTSATASCEDLILTINLPGEVYTGLDLEVTESNITLNGSIHRLVLTLPHPVNPDLSKADWNKDEEVLRLTLRMAREFDYINF